MQNGKMINKAQYYVKTCVPETASQFQKDDIEQAFMAGMFQMLLHVQEVSKNESEELAAQELGEVDQELQSYIMKKIKKGVESEGL